MCRFQLLHGFSQVLWGSLLILQHPLPSFFFLLILMPSSHQGVKRYLSSHYRKRWLQDVSHSTAKPNQPVSCDSVLETCISVTEAGESFRKWQHLVLKLPKSPSSSCWVEFTASKYYLPQCYLQPKTRILSHWDHQTHAVREKKERNSFRNDIFPSIFDFLK